ncbi:hypothetical protein LTR33_016930, partial [Friedmanniomyces endolithicus]
RQKFGAELVWRAIRPADRSSGPRGSVARAAPEAAGSPAFAHAEDRPADWELGWGVEE